MKKMARTSPVSIAVLAEKMDVVRALATNLGVAFKEQVHETESDVTKFTFNLTAAEVQQLLQQFPRDAFAYRGVLDSAPE